MLLLPFQVSVLDVPSPAVTPTNLLYNVVGTPGGLVRYWRTGALRGRLATTLLIGTLPGVVAGAVVRVELLSGSRAFLLVIAAVLLPLGAWLALGRMPVPGGQSPPPPGPRITALALAVGVVGGIYGIGGGSILAPILLGLGFSIYEVAGAALLSTFVTSIAGVLTYELLAVTAGAGQVVGPDWPIGLAAGAGGLAGSYLGARLQPHVPERALRRLLGVLAMAIALRYASSAIG